MPANNATKIIYDPENGNTPVSIIPGNNPNEALQITDPGAIQAFIDISRDPDGNPNLGNIQSHLRDTFQLDIGDSFVTANPSGEAQPSTPGQIQSSGEEEIDIGMGNSTQGTVGPEGDQDIVNDELELAIDLNSVESTDNIIKEIINMNKKDAKLFTEKEKKHQQVVEDYKERIVSDDFITEMAMVVEDDREAGTSLKNNSIKAPKDDGVKQDFEVGEGNTTDFSASAEYGEDIAPSVDEDTISKPLDAENNYMNTGVDDYNVPVNDATEGDARATTANTGTEAGEYADPKQKSTLDDSGWNKANYDEKMGISKDEYEFLMEEVDETDEEESEESEDGGGDEE